MIELLPKMKTDISLSREGKTLIIDTKMYEKMLQSNYGHDSQHSNNMYQIYAYVKNKDVNHNKSVDGMLLYARTDEEILPDKTYILDGNRFYIKSIDLNDNFKNISKELNKIIETSFPSN